MVLPALFGAVTSLLPSMDGISQLTDLISDTGNAFAVAQNTAQSFYGSVIGSNLELQQIIRQSSIVIASQTKAFDKLGNELNFDDKLAAIGPRIKQVQKEIELATRDIVGATDSQTNAILNQTITQFSALQNQTKAYKDELSAVPDLVAGLASAFNTFQIPDFQIPQEIRSLLQGDLNNPDSQLARQLQSTGLTKQAFEEAKAQGTLLDLLIEKTKAFTDANASGATTITNSFSIIKDVTEQLFRSVGEDPTEGLRSGLATVANILNDVDLESKLKGIASAFGGPIGEAISEAFARATLAVKEFFSSLPEGALENLFANLGQVVGDTITIVTDVGLAIAKIVADIVIFLNNLTNLYEGLVDVLSFNLGSNVNFNKEEASASVQRQVDEFAKDLDTRGGLRKTFDLLIDVTPFGVINNAKRAPQIKEIEEAYSNTIDFYQDEIDGKGAEQLEFLLDMAPKIAKVDTSKIDGFKADLLNPIQEEVNRLGSTIDFSQLSDKAASEVRNLLGSIESASDFSRVQKSIADIVANSQAGSEAAVAKFSAYNSLLAARIDSITQTRDELLQSKKEGNIGKEVDDELLQLTSQIATLKDQQREIAIQSSSAISQQVAAQRSQLEGLDDNSDEAKKIQDKIRELGDQAISEKATIMAQKSNEIGSVLVDTYNKLNDAAAQLADGAGDSAALKVEFEGLIQAVKNAETLGTTSIDQLVNVLKATAVDTTLTVEQRLQAQQTIIELLNREAALKSTLIDLEKSDLQNAVDSGKISKQAGSIEENNLSIKQKELEIATKIAELEETSRIRESGAREQLSQQIAEQQKRLETATGEEEVNIRNVIAIKQKLLAQTESASLGEQELSNEISSLENQKRSLIIKNKQLEIDERLAEISRQNAEATASLELSQSARLREIAELREQGALKADVDLAKQQASVEESQKRLDIVRQEIEERSTLNDVGLSEDSRLQLQAELNNLLAEENNLQATVIDNRLNYEAAVQKALIDREQLIIQTSYKEVEATSQLETSLLKISEAINKSKQAQQELLSLSIALSDSLNNVQLNDLGIEQAGIDRILDFKKQLSEEPEGSDRAAALESAIAATYEIADVQDTSLNRQLEIIAEKSTLEQANADRQYQLKIEQLNLENEIAKLSLNSANLALETEEAKLKVKEQELALEKESIKLKINSGEISKEAGNRQIASVDKILAANQNVATSIKEQLVSNQEQVTTLGTILETKVNILTNEKQITDRSRETTAELDRQNTILANRPSRTSANPSNSQGRGTQSSGISNTFIRGADGEKYYKKLDGSGYVSKSGESLDTTKSKSYTRIGEKDNAPFSGTPVSRSNDPLLEEFLSTSGASLSVRQALKGDRYAPASGKAAGKLTGEIFKQTILFEEWKINKEIDEKEKEKAKKEKPQQSTGGSALVAKNLSIKPFISGSSRTPDAGADKELQIEQLKTSILSLSALPQNEETQKKLTQQISLLRLLTNINASGNSEQATLLDAIKQNAFQNAGFKPTDTLTVTLDPATRELIVGGTRPDLEKLNQLIQINANQLGELTSINSKTFVPSASNSNSNSNSKPPAEGIQKDIFKANLEIPGKTNLGIARILKDAGVINNQQYQAQVLRESSGLTNIGKLGRIQDTGLITEEQEKALKLREQLRNPLITEAGKLRFYQEAGFSSREEGDKAIANLPEIETLYQEALKKISGLPSPQDLRNEYLAGRLTKVEEIPGMNINLITGAASTTTASEAPVPGLSGIIDKFSVTAAGASSPRTYQNIVNNYYPNQAGSVNSQLRTAAL